MGFLSARGQFRFPSAMHTDACPFSGAMGYPSWELACELCDVRRYIFMRIAGPVAKGRDASPKALARGAKKGSCPRCVKAPHIAVPPPFELGVYGWLTGMGAKLWPPRAPWASRRLAAANYVLGSNESPLPVGCDWAALSLEFVAPKPLIRPILRGVPAPFPAIADAEMQKKTLRKGLYATNTAKDSHENATRPTVTPNPENSGGAPPPL